MKITNSTFFKKKNKASDAPANSKKISTSEIGLNTFLQLLRIHFYPPPIRFSLFVRHLHRHHHQKKMPGRSVSNRVLKGLIRNNVHQFGISRIQPPSSTLSASQSTGYMTQPRVNVPLSNPRYFTTTLINQSNATDDHQKQKQCANCGTVLPLNALSCSSCSTLQPIPSELDAYELFGLRIEDVGSNGWEINLNKLKSSWRSFMALSHPDRMASRSEKEQKIADQQSSMLNKAYETLRDPLLRAHLLLEKFGSFIPSEAESLEDPEVLMEVMELREELEDATSEEEAGEVREKNQERLDATIEILKEAFAKNPPDLDTARSAAVGLRYWNNIDKAAREWQPGKRVEVQH